VILFSSPLILVSLGRHTAALNAAASVSFEDISAGSGAVIKVFIIASRMVSFEAIGSVCHLKIESLNNYYNFIIIKKHS